MKTYYNNPIEPLNFEDKELTQNEVRDYLQALSVHKGAFIGLIDVYDEVIIFYPKSKNNWLLDHIIVSNTLHRQRYADTQECLDFIEKIYQERDSSGFKGFLDVPVKEFTLDEVIAFKSTDDAAVKEEEPIPEEKTEEKKIVKKRDFGTSLFLEKSTDNKKESS